MQGRIECVLFRNTDVTLQAAQLLLTEDVLRPYVPQLRGFVINDGIEFVQVLAMWFALFMVDSQTYRSMTIVQ